MFGTRGLGYRHRSLENRPARVFFLLLTTGFLSAQTQQYGGYTFAVPPGYEQKVIGSQIQLAKLDTRRRTFCQLALQPAQPGMGSGAQELEKEWQMLVARQYTVNGATTTNSLRVGGGASEGMERTASTSTTNIPSMISKVLLARFPGRYVSVLLNASGADIVQVCTSDAIGFLASVRLTESAPSPVVDQPVQQSPGSGRIRTGNTPLSFPGVPDWLPSGNGLPIPNAGYVSGLPVGLWWVASAEGMADTRADMYVFLDGGIRASSPRLGGPRLYDLEGQKQQRGVTGVGTFAVENGQFMQRSDMFRSSGAYSTGSDSAGSFFKVGSSLYRPLSVVTAQSVQGHWKGYQLEISFLADGTYVYGPPTSAGRAGTYVADGYLLQRAAHSGPTIIDRAGMSGNLLILGRTILSRVR